MEATTSINYGKIVTRSMPFVKRMNGIMSKKCYIDCVKCGK